MDLKELKKNLKNDLKSLGYELYDVTYSKKDNILHVEVDKSMDLKEIEDLSKKISKIMDKYDDEFNEYLLDVSSVGLERPIRNEEELKKAVGSYIYVKTNKDEIYGSLKSFKDGILIIKHKQKNLSVESEINYKDIKKVRYAVKF